MARAQPNILVIYVDDMGNLPGFTGGDLLETPHMDALAASGMVFTNGYVSSPICGPSRVGLMTGRFPARTGQDANPKSQPGTGLLLSEKLIGEYLQGLGYATGIVGKWHLGIEDERYMPTSRGFDSFVGHAGNVNEGPELYYRNLQQIGSIPEHPVTSPLWAEEANRFIEANRSRPFFLYLAFNAVHTPHVAREDTIAEFASIVNKGLRNYAAITRDLDDAIGNVLAKLDELALRQNTLIFFISDNGKAYAPAYADDGLRGRKWYLFEGGIRVPFVISWKGKIREGSVSDTPVIQLDVLPTSIAAAGAAVDPDWGLDGVDLLPILLNDNPLPDRDFFWRFGTQFAVRSGKWKLVKALADVESPMLFNLDDDRGEQRDLSRGNPEIVDKLQHKWDAWNAHMQPPRWEDKRWNRTEEGVLGGKN